MSKAMEQRKDIAFDFGMGLYHECKRIDTPMTEDMFFAIQRAYSKAIIGGRSFNEQKTLRQVIDLGWTAADEHAKRQIAKKPTSNTLASTLGL